MHVKFETKIIYKSVHKLHSSRIEEHVHTY